MSPQKPTREDAVANPSTEEMLERGRRGGGPPAAGAAAGREQLGSAAENAKHPPHLTENAEDAPIQNNHGREQTGPVRPANAQGRDKLSTTEHSQGIDQESMYDKRPEEDKNRPPSSPDSP